MNNTKQNIIGAIAVIALLGVAWLWFTQPSSTTTVVQSPSTSFGALSNTNAPAAGTTMLNGQLLPNPTLMDYLVARQYLYFDKALGYGNTTNTAINQQAVRALMVASTSVVCSLQNPFTTASSTYEFSANISSTSALSSVLALATGFNTGATTSLQGSFPFTASVVQVISTQGTSTATGQGIVGPSAYLNLGGLVGASLMLNQLGGNCNAIFTSTN